MTNLQYNHYDWNIPIGYTLPHDISIPEQASVQYFTSHGKGLVPPEGEPGKLLLNAMIKQFGKERYARVNKYNNLPTYSSTAGLGDYKFSYLPPGNPFTGLTLEAYALGQSDAAYGAWNRQYGIVLALVYKIVQHRLGRSDTIIESGEVFNDTHLTQLREKCTDVLTELSKYDKGLQRANWNIQPVVQHIITEPILDGITGTDLTNIVGGAGGYIGSNKTLHTIVTMLDILGNDPIVTDDIRQKLERLIQREILLTIKNWKNYLSWYVVGNQTNTNQAIEPICGLIEGCLYLEDPNLLPAYEVGKTILNDSFKTGLGASGAFLEGYAYAYSTTPLIHNALRRIRDTSDTSLDASSANWVKNNWKWMVDHILPGNLIANYSDNANPKLERWLINSPHLAVTTSVVAAASVVNGVVGDFQPLKNLNAIYPNAIPGEMEQLEWYDLSKLFDSTTIDMNPLPTFVHYKDSALVIWRSERDVVEYVNNDTSGMRSFGIWIKGATPIDGHTHRDAGQISVNLGKKIILMDSGSNYNHPNQLELQGASGHNILQIDTIPLYEYPVYSGWTGCPITVNQLGATSGNVNINLLGAYKGPAVTGTNLSTEQRTLYQAGRISDISRGITWQFNIGTNLHITIKDGVTFTQSVGGEHYRWHTGSTAAIGGSEFTITQQDLMVWTARWEGVTMTMTPSRPITVTGITGPDATQASTSISYHNILKITPIDEGNNFSVTTVIDSTLELEPRPQIYAFTFFPISGNVQDWTGKLAGGFPGVGGTAEVTEFSHVKPFMNIKNSYNSVPNEINPLFAWQPPVIRNQLRMLDELNNLPNTNIKNIIFNRYQSGWLYGNDTFDNNYNDIDNVNGDTTITSRSDSGHLIWPDNEIPKMRADLVSFLTLVDVDKTNQDGLRIAKTRIISDNEYIGSSNNFSMNKPYYDALLLDPRYQRNKYGVRSLSFQMNGITWNGQGIPFCSPSSCGFNTDYLVWNKSVEKITTAALSEALLTPFRERYADVAHEFRAMNYESNITVLGDGYPGVDGHNSYHDNLFGDSANIHLYGRFNPDSSVWCIDSQDDTKLKRITNTTTETPFTWHDSNELDGPWNAFLTSIQGVRSVKRGLKSKGLTNTSIIPFIGTKEWEGEDPAGSSPAKVGFVNTQYYDEMVRHSSLTGVEVFGFFNGLTYITPINTPTGIFDTAKRREQFGVINKILVDINDKLGGYTPTTLDDSRVSYNCNYVMSGAPTADGKYLWRVTPKFSTDDIFSNDVLVPKTGSEIGVWIKTTPNIKPTISIIPSPLTAAQTVTDYEVWALHWPTYPDVFSTAPKFAIDYYGPGVTGQLQSGIGATFGTFINADGNPEFKFLFKSVAPSLQAPPTKVGDWNGWNPPGDGYTYDSTGTDQYSWNYFKDNIKKVPESKRMIQGRPWEGGNFFSASRWGYNDYYTNTADGTTYQGLRFATPWANVAATDTQISVKKFLTACKNDDLKFSYFTTDQEQSHLPWHFRKGFNVYNNGGVTAQESPTIPGSWNTRDVRSDIRFISAIINDTRFRGQTINDETGPTTKTLFNFYSDAFTALKTKYEILTGSSINLTVEDSLLPFTGLTNADPSVIASSTFWTPYNGPSNNYRGRDAKSMGYEYHHIVFPSLDYMLDNIAWNNSHKKAFVDVFKGAYNTEFNMFHDVKSIQYNAYEINESESPFLKDGNGMPYYTNASRGKVKNNAYAPVYYSLAENSMFPTFIPVTPSTIRLNTAGRFDPAGITHFLDNPKYIIGITFDSYWKIRSGYIKGSTFDLEKYSFQGYLVGDPNYYNQGGVTIGCSGCVLPTASALVRYPETYPDPANANNTEKFYLELAFKHFTNELIHARSTHRSDPLMYQKYSPFITGFASSPTPFESLQRVYSHNKYTKLYWKEFVWQLLMHGVNFFQYWDYAYTANLGLWDLHLILNQWRTLTGNSRVRPCNSLGEVSGLNNKILDRFVLEDMYEKCIISGGMILTGPMKNQYIWRISVPPKFISWNANQSFGEVVGTLTVSGSAAVTKTLAVIGDGDITPVSNFVLSNLGLCPPGIPCPADFDGNGTITIPDQVIFTNKYESENRLGFTVINPPGIKTAPTFVPNPP